MTDTHIAIRTVNQDGNETYFRIKKTTVLSKLMNAYCEKNGLRRDSVRFIFNGVRIKDQHTANDLKLQDQDVIDVMLEQLGGK